LAEQPRNAGKRVWISVRRHRKNLGKGNGNGSVLWVGGGVYNGEDVTAIGYKWNGSSWSASNLDAPNYQTIVQRLTASGSSNKI
jgi:hypothetical protein